MQQDSWVRVGQVERVERVERVEQEAQEASLTPGSTRVRCRSRRREGGGRVDTAVQLGTACFVERSTRAMRAVHLGRRPHAVILGHDEFPPLGLLSSPFSAKMLHNKLRSSVLMIHNGSHFGAYAIAMK